MLRESGSWQNIWEVPGGILSAKGIWLTAGNTSSLVIDSLCDQAEKEDIAVACLYYDFLAQQEQTVINVMGAVLKQLIGRCDILNYLRKAFQDGKTGVGDRGFLVADIVRMLRTTIASRSQVFICIDALDECLPKGLLELLESLRDIIRESQGRGCSSPGDPMSGKIFGEISPGRL